MVTDRPDGVAQRFIPHVDRKLHWIDSMEDLALNRCLESIWGWNPDSTYFYMEGTKEMNLLFVSTPCPSLPVWGCSTHCTVWRTWTRKVCLYSTSIIDATKFWLISYNGSINRGHRREDSVPRWPCWLCWLGWILISCRNRGPWGPIGAFSLGV